MPPETAGSKSPGRVKSARRRNPSTKGTSQTSPYGKTLPLSTLEAWDGLTSYLEDHHASLSRTLETGEGQTIPEARCFMKSLGLLGKSNHLFYCLKTSKGYYLAAGGRLRLNSSPRCLKLGMAFPGVIFTANITLRRTEYASSLSDVIEENAGDEYLLSLKEKRLLTSTTKKAQANGNQFRAKILTRSPQVTAGSTARVKPTLCKTA